MVTGWGEREISAKKAGDELKPRHSSFCLFTPLTYPLDLSLDPLTTSYWPPARCPPPFQHLLRYPLVLCPPLLIPTQASSPLPTSPTPHSHPCSRLFHPHCWPTSTYLMTSSPWPNLTCYRHSNPLLVSLALSLTSLWPPCEPLNTLGPSPWPGHNACPLNPPWTLTALQR